MSEKETKTNSIRTNSERSREEEVNEVTEQLTLNLNASDVSKQNFGNSAKMSEKETKANSIGSNSERSREEEDYEVTEQLNLNLNVSDVSKQNFGNSSKMSEKETKTNSIGSNNERSKEEENNEVTEHLNLNLNASDVSKQNFGNSCKMSEKETKTNSIGSNSERSKEEEEEVNEVTEQLNLNASNVKSSQHSESRYPLRSRNNTWGLKKTLHGVAYQLNLLLWCFIKGFRLFDTHLSNNTTKFSMRTEFNKAGSFDDIVLRYQDLNETETEDLYFYQLKHTLDSELKIRGGELLSRTSGLSLAKYFKSYLEIKGRFDQKSNIKCLTIFTNRDFNFSNNTNSQKEVRRLKYIKTKDRESGEIYFREYNKLDKGSSRDLLIFENTGKRYQIMVEKFETDQVERRKIEKFLDVLQANFKSHPKLNEIQTQITRDSIKDFLQNLVFAVQQPFEHEIEGKIIKEIGAEFGMILGQFQNEIWNWFKAKQSDWMGETEAKRLNQKIEVMLRKHREYLSEITERFGEMSLRENK